MFKKNTNPQRIFIGVSWPYANGSLHLGHLAGQDIVADVFARYHRLKGNNVLMVSGSDSHGAPVVLKAEEQGITPAELAEKSHKGIVNLYSRLGLIYENYTKTTTELHKEVSQNIFLVLKQNGYLNIEKSNQYYDEKVKRFLPDRYVRGTCPNCKATNARGDECPECGAFLEPEQLIDPYSTLSDSKPVMKETEHFYMDLRALQPQLKDWIENNSSHWRKWVREFSLGWIKEGLQPRAVTRDMKFGVPVPVEGWENKVLYVWIEAVVGYLSASIEWAEKQGTPSSWEDFWKDPAAKHYYFIAGGNVPFHTIMWPGEIIAYNEKYLNTFDDRLKLPGETLNKPLNLPFDVPGNNMLTHKGKKMSKGDESGITVEGILDTYGADALRYFFIRNAPETSDREFTWLDFIETNNNELVANLGNFINRTLTFSYRNFEGKVPEGTLSDDVNEAIQKAFSEVGESIEQNQFIKSTESLLALGKFANKYFNDETPWETVKTDQDKAGNTIFNAIQLVNAIRLLIRPFMPDSAKNIANLLNVENEYDANSELELHGTYSGNLNEWEFINIEPGNIIKEPSIIFNKFEYSEDLQNQDKGIVNLSEKYKGVVIAEIVDAKVHPNSPELAIYQISFGEDKSATIVSKDMSLKVKDKAAYITPGSSVPGSKGEDIIEITEVSGVKSEGMLASAKELDLMNNNVTVLKLKTDAVPGVSFAEAYPNGYPISECIDLEISEDLKEIPVIYKIYTDLKIKKMSPNQRNSLKSQIESLFTEKSQKSDWKFDPIFKGYVELHDKYSEEKGLHSSSEDLINKILSEGALPKVNNFVDVYNLVSAMTGVSIGVHDISLLKGNIRFEILSKDTPYQEIGSGNTVIAKKGEYAYVDDEGVICRLDTKQGQRTRISPKSESVLVILQGHHSLGIEKLEEALALLDQMLKVYCTEA